MAATKKADLAKTSGTGLASLVRDGNWDFPTIFNMPLAKMTREQVAGAWLLVDLMEEITKDRKGELREALLEECAKRGITDEKGSFLMEVQGAKIKREKRQGKLPEEEGLKALLEKYRVDLDDCFDKVEYRVLNASKLESLIDTGKLPASEVDALKKITWALKVDPTDEVKKDLDTIMSRMGKLKPAKGTKALK
jgi:hypothetical protein